MNMLGMIEKAKAYALANYENGFDTFVECFDHDEWVEFIGEMDSWLEVKDMMDCLADVWRDRRAYTSEDF